VSARTNGGGSERLCAGVWLCERMGVCEVKRGGVGVRGRTNKGDRGHGHEKVSEKVGERAQGREREKEKKRKRKKGKGRQGKENE